MLFALCAMLCSCGYTTGAVLPSDIKTVHVAIFKNSIDITKEISAKDKYEVYRPNLEVDLRDEIVERFFLDGHLKVAKQGSSGAILTGEITHYRKAPLRYQNEEVREYRISLVCDFRLMDSSGSEALVEMDQVTGDATYFTTGSLQKSETAALTDAMQDLARRIVNRVVENW
ncbi:MAG: hypothetical protein KJ706_09390 [Candidatus Omnitrophica bacterium]|nr:hypothetical protein [Candidatus Omnitrophota bacterium]MBU4589814.1 hypothetical protein [Candidatus Omnitrophota bacterium]